MIKKQERKIAQFVLPIEPLLLLLKELGGMDSDYGDLLPEDAKTCGDHQFLAADEELRVNLEAESYPDRFKYPGYDTPIQSDFLGEVKYRGAVEALRRRGWVKVQPDAVVQS